MLQTLESDGRSDRKGDILVREWDDNKGEEGRESIANVGPVNFEYTGQK
jgi:hypothetical protein